MAKRGRPEKAKNAAIRAIKAGKDSTIAGGGGPKRRVNVVWDVENVDPEELKTKARARSARAKGRAKKR